MCHRQRTVFGPLSSVAFAVMLVTGAQGCGGGGGSCVSAAAACGAGASCCAGLGCVLGRCVPTAGCTLTTACINGAARGSCCVAFPYCTGTPGTGIKVCSASCGASGRSCGSDEDCCSGRCAAGVCIDATVEVRQLGQPCGLSSDCGDASLTCRFFRDATTGFCTRDCNEDIDCGPSGACISETCLRPCSASGGHCGPGALCWSLGVCFPHCGSASGDVCGSRQTCGATGECAETGCTSGGGTCDMGFECCASAPYCVAPFGGNLACNPQCGHEGVACGGSGDCCRGYACLTARCQFLCEGMACVVGLSGGGCCPSAPFCNSSSLSAPIACSRLCAHVSGRCAGNIDCCQGLRCNNGVCGI